MTATTQRIITMLDQYIASNERMIEQAQDDAAFRLSARLAKAVAQRIRDDLATSQVINAYRLFDHATSQSLTFDETAVQREVTHLTMMIVEWSLNETTPETETALEG